MYTAFVVVCLVTIAVNAFFASADFMRCKFVFANMAKLGIPESSVTILGGLKAAGAIGLLLGLFGVPLIGLIAGIGLVLFFTGAVVTHIRAGDQSVGFPATLLLLALATVSMALAV